MWQIFLWACPLLGLTCDPAPNVATIQTAYEGEASSGSALHDKGLRVVAAKCHGRGGEQFLCEVSFISDGDPTERLYFDIVAVARIGGGWKLQSGLCRR